jgi:hypothetical protein
MLIEWGSQKHVKGKIKHFRTKYEGKRYKKYLNWSQLKDVWELN